ncbi:cadmium resistance transporter [Nicoliella lavandulae]|uniref:Cadmium resistance transporter n=1 Tax=Nicoliella lavandulae TaxID=3082954 RepID=A0ABU8SMI0_9LACO
MFNSIMTGITAYISTGIDYILILMTVLAFNQTTTERIKVYWGDLIGTIVLVATSLALSFSAKLIPADWILGLLGIIPIIIGIIILTKLGDEDEHEQVVKRLSKRHLVLNVAIITITTCGADNIGIYVPIFAQINQWHSLLIILVTFLIMLTVFFGLALLFINIPIVAKLLDRYGDIFTAIVYIGIGLFIMIEANTFGTIVHLVINS